MLIEAAVLLGQSVFCIPLLAVVIWAIPDITIERVDEHDGVDGSLETGNSSDKEPTSMKKDETIMDNENAVVPIVKAQ